MSRFKLNAVRKTIFLTLCLLLGLTGLARADSIDGFTLVGTDPSYPSWPTATISLTGFNGGNPSSEPTVEMGLQLNMTSGNFQDVIAYCVDIPQSVYLGGSYSVSDSGSNYTYNSLASDSNPGILQAGWLLGHFAPGLGNGLIAGNSYGSQGAALQLAIWSVVYDYETSYGSNFLDTTTGPFTVISADAQVKALANQFLAAIPSGGDLSQTGLGLSGVLHSADFQDLVFGSPGGGGAVPEPGSMLLLGSAAGLLGWFRRRTRRAQRLSAQTA